MMATCSLMMLFFLILFSPWQDGVYHSMQSLVDWFREAVGMPLEKKYNTVLFGGIGTSSHCLLSFVCHDDHVASDKS